MNIPLPGPFFSFSLLALIGLFLSRWLPGADFTRVFLDQPPILVVMLALGAGAVALFKLQPSGWAAPGRPTTTLMLRALLTGALFAVPLIVFDLAVGVNEATVAFPDGLAYYPVVGYVFEVVFHLLPLYLVVSVMPRAFWPAATLAALAEPAWLIWTTGALDPGTAALAVTLAALGAYQIVTLRAAGFGPAFTLRLGFYIAWALLWGSFSAPV